MFGSSSTTSNSGMGSSRIREQQSEFSAAQGAIAHAESSAVRGRHVLTDRESQASAGLFGGDERLEQGGHHAGRNARATVCQANGQPARLGPLLMPLADDPHGVMH